MNRTPVLSRPGEDRFTPSHDSASSLPSPSRCPNSLGPLFLYFCNRRFVLHGKQIRLFPKGSQGFLSKKPSCSAPSFRPLFLALPDPRTGLANRWKSQLLHPAFFPTSFELESQRLLFTYFRGFFLIGSVLASLPQDKICVPQPSRSPKLELYLPFFSRVEVRRPCLWRLPLLPSSFDSPPPSLGVYDIPPFLFPPLQGSPS